MSNVECQTKQGKSQKSKDKGQKSRPATFDFRLSTLPLSPSTCDFRLSTSRRGFSLLELIVVMLVISILTVLVFEKIATVLSSTRVQLAANELSVNLCYIRNMAMDQERTTRVIFSVASNNYTVSIDTNRLGSYALANDPVKQSPWLVTISDRFSGVALTNVNIGGTNGATLYFSRTNGIPLINTNGAPLTNNGIIQFNSGLTITIAPDTGYIGLE